MRRRWGVLISGRGSNLAAILDMGEEIDLRLVVSSSPDAYGLLRARRAGVPAVLTPFLPGTKKIDWENLALMLRAHGITDVILAGFMKIVPKDFIAQFEQQSGGRILNLHPSLLPAYPGLRSIERAHSEHADMGVSVHLVNEEVDAGEILCRRRSLKGEVIHAYSLDLAEFLIHVDEQRSIREAIRQWNNAPTS